MQVAIKFIERREVVRNQKNIRREIVNHSALMHPHIIQFRRWEAPLAVHVAQKILQRPYCAEMQGISVLDTWLHCSQMRGDGGAAARHLALKLFETSRVTQCLASSQFARRSSCTEVKREGAHRSTWGL